MSTYTENILNIPSNPSNVSFIFSSIIKDYETIKKTLDALSMLHTIYIRNINNVYNYMTRSIYIETHNIMSNLEIEKSLLPNINKTTTSEDLSQAVIDFFDPSLIKSKEGYSYIAVEDVATAPLNIDQKYMSLITPEIQSLILQFTMEQHKTSFKTPVSTIHDIEKTNSNLKLDNFITKFGIHYTNYISHFLNERDLVESNEIISLIDKLSLIEDFIITTQLIKPSWDMIAQSTSLMYSDYYKDLFLLDNNGKFKYSSIITDSEQCSYTEEIITRCIFYLNDNTSQTIEQFSQKSILPEENAITYLIEI